MHRLLSLFARFRSDERGAFLVIFAVSAIVLIAMSGAAVDYTSVEQARTRAQVALDAAALALQPQIYTKTPEQLRKLAEDLLIERLGDWKLCTANVTPCAGVSSAVVDTTNGVITLNANLDVPLYFVALIGINHIKANLLSTVSHKKLNLEVAFVLDNSNSMDTNSRMTNLISATKCAANMLFNGDCASTATVSTNAYASMAIIPFTMLVNVGTGNASAAWMDRKGLGSTNITTNNFDDDNNDATTFAGGVDRIALFNSMKGASWGGCVEARKYPNDTNDVPPVSTNSDTMFTPMFAPDEPDSGFSNSYIPDTPSTLLQCPKAPVCVNTQTKTLCNTVGNTSSTFNASVCVLTVDTYSYTNELGVTLPVASCPATAYNNTGTSSDAYSSVKIANLNYTNVRTRTWNYPFSNRELQERMCKYNGATVVNPNQASAHGPNSDCPVNAITPLTTNKATITAAIAQLDPQGGTNIHVGTEWGFHVLSPSAPFTEAKPYNSTDTAKYMIIMTDGENTAYQTANMNNTTFYSSYGYPYNGRMGTASSTNAQLVTEMNKRTVETCANAKAAGITVYTVGLSVDQTSNVAANTAMLQSCASTPQNAYFPTASSQLTEVFKNIINEIDQLRITQ